MSWAGVDPDSSETFPALPVNTPPEATANTVTTTANQAYAFSVSDFTYTDAERDSLVSATLSNLSLGGGTLTDKDGIEVSPGDSLKAETLERLLYTPSGTSTGSPLASFDFTVNDMNMGRVAAQMAINVTEPPPPPPPPPDEPGAGDVPASPIDPTITDEPATADEPILTDQPVVTNTGGSSGALGPVAILVMFLIGMRRRIPIEVGRSGFSSEP